MENTSKASHPQSAYGQDFASTLADFVCGLSSVRLSQEIVAAAKENIFDTLACAVAGSTAPGVGEVRDLALEWGGAQQASTFVFRDKMPAHHAAWVNGTMSHARDYDDTHDAAVLHAGVSVVPAALAAAELRGKTSGAELIAGVATGLETISRLGVATTVSIIESGYMYTSLFGHFAATVAASKILGLDHTGIVNALGIAYSQVSGNHQVTRDAALTKRMQPGFAAMSGVLSAQLASRGIRGAQSTFEGVDGFFRVYLGNRYDPDVLRDGLGTRFEFLALSYKPYPCCRFNHCGIEAALELRKEIGDRIHDIERIRVGLNQQAYQAVCTPIDVRRSPETIVQAQFSIPYTVAAALIDGEVSLRHFRPDLKDRHDIISLAQQVHPYVHEDIERGYGRNVSPVLIDIGMKDGRTLSHRIDIPRGHPQRRMTKADFLNKAKDCFEASARAFEPGTHERLYERVSYLDTLTDIDQLLQVFD